MPTNEAKIYIAALLIAAILGIILVYFVITMLRQQKRNLILHKEKIQAEIVTLENERKRIASDLHDELGPLLSSVRLQIGCLNTEDEEDKDIIERSQAHIDTMLHRLREISNDLMPNVLLRKGLVSATQEFADNIRSSGVLSINFSGNDIVIFSKEMEIHLYRIIREIIHNTIKHAEAENLNIHLSQAENKIVLQTTDDGIGFDYEQTQKMGAGLGLTNIQSRIEILSGSLYGESKIGKGTRYHIEIPIKNNEKSTTY